MSAFIIILVGLCCSQRLQGQKNYREVLSSRLDKIKKLDVYDNKVVGGIDTVEYNDMSFPYWKQVTSTTRTT